VGGNTPFDALPTASLSLDNRGRLRPFYIEDGGDGDFGPGDWLEFAADVAAGESTYYHPHTNQNVYWLRLESEKSRRLPRASTPNQHSLQKSESIKALRRQHLERDQLLIRLASKDVVPGTEPELWYWSKLTHLSSDPFAIEIAMEDADPAEPIALQVNLRGLSELRTRSATDASAAGAKEHQAEISSGGVLLGRAAWNGRQPFKLSRSATSWPASETPNQRSLEIRVPERLDGENPLVDVVMVDWVEVTYAYNGQLAGDQVEIHLPTAARGILELHSAPSDRLVVVGEQLGYLELTFPAANTTSAGGNSSLKLEVPQNETTLWLRREGAALRPITIERDRSSNLRSFSKQADYLVIAHGSLLEAARGLAALHRDRGLAVELIDVQDIYDEFGDGVVAPEAIRDFLTHAHHNWQRPKPRFVLLIGDASWDTKNSTVDDANYSNWVGRQLVKSERFSAKKTEDYDPDRRNDRNLIPSWNYHTSEGHAASDAYYTFLAGADELPDVALGRFPVASAEEVHAITAKIRRYLEEAPLGPWRGRLVWISGGLEAHKRRSTALAKDFAGQGLPGTLVLPGNKARPEDRTRIIDAFDSGHLVTHFIGHGGRFIWRTGPPDLKNQVDLFGLEDLERLPAAPDLPVVLSVACYSAPFDHPSADSIGEAFLRLPDKGAIAFIGASWRNSPPQSLSSSLVAELSRPGTVGEALMRTKRQMTQSDAIHLFNLLGDPAVPVAAPQQTLDVAPRVVDGTLELGLELPPSALGGRISIDFLDADGVRIETIEIAAERIDQRISHPLAPEAHTVTVYFWNESTRVDGVGGALIERPEVQPDIAGAL